MIKLKTNILFCVIPFLIAWSSVKAHKGDSHQPFQVHNVTESFISDVHNQGYPDISNDDLIAFRIHDVTIEFIEELKKNGVIIPTLEGQHIASWGDFIIKGVKGEFYPCKPDIFEMTYEKFV